MTNTVWTFPVRIENDHCFFNESLEKTNGKGISCCESNFIGWILEFFGITYKLNVQENGRQRNCYLYTEAAITWVNSNLNWGYHEKVTQATKHLIAEKIKVICNKDRIQMNVGDNYAISERRWRDEGHEWCKRQK